MRCDLKLTGGSVIDGSGAPARRADVAVADGRIVALGDLADLEAAAVLDCSGRHVVPGFIDLHSHSDWLLPGADHGALVEPFARQGMTTLVGGNCGFSPAPLVPRNRKSARASSRLIVGQEIETSWSSMAEFLAALEAGGVALNTAQLVGHGSVRSAVMGPLDAATPDAEALGRMEALVREALDAGCVGVSTGLGYAPGIFAGEDELAAAAGWASAAGRIFTSHLRAYSTVSGAYRDAPAGRAHNLLAIEEILRVARRAQARLQISHLIFVGRTTWPSHEQALGLIEAAHAAGLDVAFDAFPYTAGNTTAAVLMPAAVLSRLEEILADRDQRAGLRSFADAAFASLGFGLGELQIMHANAEALNRYDGLRIPEAAAREGMDPFDFYCRLLIESGREARVLIHGYSGAPDDESALRAVLRHPLCTIETDTFVTREGHQNPASFGTFPRVLATYVREGLFPLEEAVRKMTGAAAERFGWSDRGFVRAGCAADLVVLDPATLRDTATLDDPARFPSGIEHVFVNGAHVLDGDRYDPKARAGQVLRA